MLVIFILSLTSLFFFPLSGRERLIFQFPSQEFYAPQEWFFKDAEFDGTLSHLISEDQRENLVYDQLFFIDVQPGAAQSQLGSGVPIKIHATKPTLYETYETIVLKSISLEKELNQKVLGQENAVKCTSETILRYAAGVNDPELPIASLLYCGPSGVGKTELAKQLCISLYNDLSHFVRINMSEYVEAHSISRLIGAPPGYIGYERGGVLASRLLNEPYSVVLLDEIEKAHPQVLKLFLHVFDAGYFTSSQGKDIDCSKAIFILTSNLASQEIVRLYQKGLHDQEILELLTPIFMEALSPEMFNRLDCIIFSPLSERIIEKLVLKMLSDLRAKIAKAKNMDICFDKSVINYLKNFVLDLNLGVRPLKRLIDRELTTFLAKAILAKTCKSGDCLLCSYEEGSIILEVFITEE